MGSRWLLSFVLGLTPLACGGNDDDDGDSPKGDPAALKAACYAMCDQQEKGPGCVPEYAGVCKQGCDLVTPSLADKCPDVADAYYECNAGIEFACVLMSPVAKDQNACKTQDAAMKDCTQ
ncbi:MAG: hypothetical protein IT375_28135 [Polyangiaceae bacterium]|nr:hypothetical protein [Polyangiaceae bacterium]